MKSEYLVTIDQQQYRVSQTNAQSFLIDENAYTVDFSQRDRNSYSLILNGQVFRIEYLEPGVSNNTESIEQIMYISVNGREYAVTIDDHRSVFLKSLVQKRITKEGSFTVYSPMPGLIVKVEIQEGDEVLSGEGLIVLEAMKMENELKAPEKGKIIAVHVKPGQAVEKGEKLVTMSKV